MTTGKNYIIIFGNIVHCIKYSEIVLIENGYLIVCDCKIVSIGLEKDFEIVKRQFSIASAEVIRLTKTQLLIPGFIDTHIHALQYPNCGLGYDKPLLEWLDLYTYDLEKRCKDVDFAEKISNAVVKNTLNHGTTTATYFASLLNDISMTVVNAAIKHGQRALVGKINMTCLAPTDYIENHEDSVANTLDFIRDVLEKKNDLVRPIVTPRFALSVEMDLMKLLGTIAQDNNLHIQSHISENPNEVKLVNEKFGKAYAAVYDEAKLLTRKTVLAHGVYLSESEMKLLAIRGTSISHCPESNNNLQSGMCDVVTLIKNGVTVGLGTDVAGGASPSIVNTMRSALATSINLSFSKNNYKPLSWKEVFYLATLGGAKAISMDDIIGNFDIEKQFDALVIDVDVEHGFCDYLEPVSPLENLQKFIYLGDDRNIVQVFVAGKKVK